MLKLVIELNPTPGFDALIYSEQAPRASEVTAAALVAVSGGVSSSEHISAGLLEGL